MIFMMIWRKKKKKKARKKRESGAEILASFGAKYDPILFPF